MKDRGHGSYREPRGFKAGAKPKRVSLDAGGRKESGGGGTISKDNGWKGKGKSSSDYGKAGPGKGPKGTRTSPGRQAPKGQSRMGFSDPA